MTKLSHRLIPSRRRWLAWALALPCCVLLVLSVYRWQQQGQGVLFTFPVYGFDPRDLLSGHHLAYTVDYGLDKPCNQEASEPLALCLSTKERLLLPAEIKDRCRLYLLGRCEYGRFVSGIERLYVPESRAQELDQVLRSHIGEIQLRINNGRARIVDLTIDGISWQSDNH